MEFVGKCFASDVLCCGCLVWKCLTAHESLRLESFQHFLPSPNLPGTLCYVRASAASVLVFFQQTKLHSLAKFLLVLPDSFTEWSGVWRWISSWGDWPKARDSFKRQTEQNGFDIVVLLTLIINFGLVLCSSCIGALCGCYHLYMLFISFNLMILVTQSLLKPSYCQFRFPRQLVVRSDGLLRRRPHQLIAVADTKQVLSNQHECHLFPPGSPSTNDLMFSRFRVFSDVDCLLHDSSLNSLANTTQTHLS